jgi:alpha-L-fucosidase 2
MLHKKFRTKMNSNSFTEIIPYYHYSRTESGWRDGMVAGNGENGVVCSCSPYSETLIYQNIYFNMPSRQPRFVPPEVTKELEEARQAVINFDDSWNVHDRKRTYLYCYHPAHQLRLNMPKEEILEYTRETDYETAEIIVKYTDKNGTWSRRTFTSREDNVTITKITKSDSGGKINVDISIDDASSMKNFGNGIFDSGKKRDEENMQYKKLVDEECTYISMVAHYPSYDGSELAEGGFAGVTRVIAVGGLKKKVQGNDTKESIYVGTEKNPFIGITGADEVYLITKAARTHHMCNLSEFAAIEKVDIVNELMSDIEKTVKKYTDNKGEFSYDSALAPHTKKQSALYNAVSFRLGSDMDKDDYNEDLLEKQKSSQNLLDEIVERAYNQGRYAQICCSGFSAPRLCGLWTGEWNPGWNGAYTMDANVNLQVSGMNTGNVYDAAIGYIYFILRQVKDWEENAAMVYGMKNAVLVPVNTDGDRAVMVEYDQYYPFQYWNAGASWMALPIYEFWQCFGNQKIPVNDKISHLYQQEYLDLEKDILYPLLKKQANFWEQLCTPEYYTDIKGKACYEKGKKELSDGEKYIILPSYSPENKPNGYNSTITANAAMDISAARDGLKMTIDIEKTLVYNGYKKEVERWEKLINRLPEYKYDETGALREWAMSEYEENNEHRHISHLYCAWPAYEAHNNEALTAACNTAIANRNRENAGKDDTASHGWIHKALVAARLKNGEAAYELLYTVMSSDIYFTSLMTDHNTDRSVGVYCTDTSIGTVGIINEMLLYSNTGEIELLPALPKKWAKGSINGLMARTNAQVTKLEWNLEEGTAAVSIRSFIPQSIKVACRIGKGDFIASNGKTAANGAMMKFNRDEEISFEVRL